MFESCIRTLIIHTGPEYLIEKIYGCKNDSEILFTTKVGGHIPSGFSVATISSFKSIESGHGVYRGKKCMKNFLNSEESVQWGQSILKRTKWSC